MTESTRVAVEETLLEDTQPGGLYLLMDELVERRSELQERLRECHIRKRVLMIGGDPESELEEINEDIRILDERVSGIEAKMAEIIGQEHIECVFLRPGMLACIELEINGRKRNLLVHIVSNNESSEANGVRRLPTQTPLGACLCGASRKEHIQYPCPNGAPGRCYVVDIFPNLEAVPKALLQGV